MIVSDLIAQRVTTQPNDIAIVSIDTELTWSELAEQVDGMTARFGNQQVSADSHFALYETNSVEYIITLLALWHLHATVILFSHRFPNEMVQSLTETVKPPAGAPSGAVLFTSGTTKTPKAALLSVKKLYYNALGSNERLPFQPGNRWLLSLPLYHVGGLGILFRALISGGTIIVPPTEMNLSHAIAQFQPTHLSLVPTQLHRLLTQTDSIIKRPTAVLMGGAQLSPLLAQKAIDAGLSIYASYGLTEMGSQVCTKRVTNISGMTVGCGSPLNYRELRIATTGEIQVKGDTLFQGYIDDHDLLRLPLDSDGWFSTGDIGYLDAHGSLHVTGRKDNMFISGGENIFPEEIESALSEIDGIAEAIVVPVTDPEFGARPVTFVRCSGTLAFNESNIRKLLETTALPRFKLPVRIFDWPGDILGDQMKLNRQLFKQKADELMRKLS